jgi:hypothetical protein
VTLRHNELRDFTAGLLAEICRDVVLEPPLESLTGEAFLNPTAIQLKPLDLMLV